MIEFRMAEDQQEEVDERGLGPAYDLLHSGLLAFADMEENGLRVDPDYFAEQNAHLARRLEYLEDRLERFKPIRAWRHFAGKRFTLGSDQQLAHLLYDVMKIEEPEDGRKVDKTALIKAGVDFGDDLIEWRRLDKLKGTYLGQLLREECGGVLRPSFGLSIPVTYRGQSDHPNGQNNPKRNDDSAKIIRRGIIPRPGNRLTEFDFKGMEICVSACYHQDPNMIRYLEGHADGSLDLHWDMARMLLRLPDDEPASKKIRYQGKNGFVFPQFYGDYYKNCAGAIWEASATLALVDGTPLRDHLASKGIWSYSSFEKHVEKIEAHFWGSMFPVYSKWRDRWFSDYERSGGFRQLTGFIESGLMDRNQVINHPVQGAAFHVLLWTLIQTNSLLHDPVNPWEAMIVAQIHDSMLTDHPPEEGSELVRAVREIATVRVREKWDWICVPLIIEVEQSEIDGNWYEMEEVEA
jgi:DNA polymerase I-like protein with 3'-5' exonuclease and polymerase domains